MSISVLQSRAHNFSKYASSLSRTLGPRAKRSTSLPRVGCKTSASGVEAVDGLGHSNGVEDVLIAS